VKLEKDSNPVAFTPYKLDVADQIISDKEKTIGAYDRKHRRLDYDWSILGVDPELIMQATKERELWDNWSTAEDFPNIGTDLSESHRGLNDWFSRYPDIYDVVSALPHPLSLKGARVLDIGGSGKDAVYWLAE
jgi:hypothetical protein